MRALSCRSFSVVEVEMTVGRILEKVRGEKGTTLYDRDSISCISVPEIVAKKLSVGDVLRATCIQDGKTDFASFVGVEVLEVSLRVTNGWDILHRDNRLPLE